jgi:hypothetical protein
MRVAIVVARRLYVAGERRVEAWEAGPNRLDPDLVRLPEGNERWILQSGGGAVHHERSGRKRE